MTKLMVGDPVRIIKDEDLQEYGLHNGDLGSINNLIEIEGIEYAFFMPHGVLKSYVFPSQFLELVDEDEAKEQGLNAINEAILKQMEG